MNNPRCGLCGAKMRKSGKTSSGRQRWRCAACDASSVRRIDSKAKALDRFLGWLLSKRSIAELEVGRSTFWRMASEVWRI